MAKRIVADDRQWEVYALADPEAPSIVRYVGVTFRGAKRRRDDHVYAATHGGKTYRDNWIRKLLARGVKPRVSVLEAGSGSSWDVREQYWIAHYRELVPSLTNLTNGGDGAIGYVQTEAARLSKVAAARKLWESPEYREKQSIAQRQKKATPETRAKLSESHKRRGPVSAETRARISAAGMGRKHTPETKAKMVEAQTRITDETRKKLADSARGRTHTAESKAKMRQAKLGKTMSAEARAKLSKHNKGKALSEEHKDRIRAAMIGRKHSDEARAKMVEAHRQRRLRKQPASSGSPSAE